MIERDASTGSPAAAGTGEAAPPMPRGRAVIVHAALVLFAIAIIAKSVQLQIVDHDRWTRVAASQHVSEEEIIPPRGPILDAAGRVLVETREEIALVVEPRLLRTARRRGAKKNDPPVDTRTVLRQGLRSLNVAEKFITRALDTTRKWVEIPGSFLPSDVQRFAGLPGIRRTSVPRRINSAPEGMRGVLGTINRENVAVSGIERELDALLTGRAGRNQFLRDPRAGGVVESPGLAAVQARQGHTVLLTINRSLQYIAESELALARGRTGATGGDVVIMDPRDGGILAMVGVRDGKASVAATSLTQAYQPGSVVKPFVLARLLDLHKARLDESIDTENGKYVIARRTITDVHKAEFLTFRDVVRYSSNIGTAKLAMRLSPREHYESMRDFGFGTYTGVTYPSESRGSLPMPARWGAMTPASLSIGYEMSATPMQLAAAYAAIANGGELLQPVLIREVRDADGRMVYRHQRRVVRRAMSETAAAVMRDLLKSVVDSGTAMAASLTTYDVAGKSGTARRVEGNSYDASFAGMFPAQAPQYVIIARLIDPQGTYYGGVVAGALVNGILQNAIATRDASLDLDALAKVSKQPPRVKVKPLSPQALAMAKRDSVRFDSLRAPIPARAEPPAVADRVVIDLPLTAAPPSSGRRPSPGAVNSASRAIPSVYGLDPRQAARTLFDAGFHVSIVYGTVLRTRPQAGVLAPGGSTVQLEQPLLRLRRADRSPRTAGRR